MAELAAGIDRHPDKQGDEPCVAGTRVPVRRIGHLADEAGRSPDVIAERFDLTVSDVHRALAYYYDHPDEMATYTERDRERARGASTESESFAAARDRLAGDS